MWKTSVLKLWDIFVIPLFSYLLSSIPDLMLFAVAVVMCVYWIHWKMGLKGKNELSLFIHIFSYFYFFFIGHEVLAFQVGCLIVLKY